MKKLNSKYQVELTDADRMILNSYCAMSDGLINYLGDMYEITVHSFGIGDNFILKIINGHLSGRTIEVEIPKGAYAIIEQLQLQHKLGDAPFTSTFSICSNGNKLKTAAIGIIGEGNRLIGIFNINCCLDAPLSEFIKNFTLPIYLKDGPVSFVKSVDNRQASSLAQTVIAVRDSVLQDKSIPAKYKRKETIRKLNDAGIFNIKNAIQICADVLDISIATIYMHLKSFEE